MQRRHWSWCAWALFWEELGERGGKRGVAGSRRAGRRAGPGAGRAGKHAYGGRPGSLKRTTPPCVSLDDGSKPFPRQAPPAAKRAHLAPQTRPRLASSHPDGPSRRSLKQESPRGAAPRGPSPHTLKHQQSSLNVRHLFASIAGALQLIALGDGVDGQFSGRSALCSNGERDLLPASRSTTRSLSPTSPATR